MTKLSITLVVALAQLASLNLYWRPSVRSELAAIQEKTGTTLVQFDGRWASGVDFAQRNEHELSLPPLEATHGPAAVSPDGNRIAYRQKSSAVPEGVLAVAGTDGKALRAFPEIRGPSYYCWSSDGKWLATVVGRDGVEAIEVETGSRRRVGKGFVSYPCWSSDNSQLVYFEADPGKVIVFDLSSGKSRTVVQGSYATWSPDGKWIAYWHAGKHHLISPATGEKRAVMEDDSGGPLHWSPDSRFVAYLSRPRFFEGLSTLFDPVPGHEELRLRVQRMADKKEEWVLRMPSQGPRPLDYYWVVGADRLRRQSPASKPN